MSMQKSTNSSRAWLAEGRVEVFFDMFARAASSQRRLIASDDGDSAVPETHENNFYSSLAPFSHCSKTRCDTFLPRRQRWQR